jgi:hypothetical protein
MVEGAGFGVAADIGFDVAIRPVPLRFATVELDSEPAVGLECSALDRDGRIFLDDMAQMYAEAVHDDGRADRNVVEGLGVHGRLGDGRRKNSLGCQPVTPAGAALSLSLLPESQGGDCAFENAPPTGHGQDSYATWVAVHKIHNDISKLK